MFFYCLLIQPLISKFTTMSSSKRRKTCRHTSPLINNPISELFMSQFFSETKMISELHHHILGKLRKVPEQSFDFIKITGVKQLPVCSSPHSRLFNVSCQFSRLANPPTNLSLSHSSSVTVCVFASVCVAGSTLMPVYFHLPNELLSIDL